MPCLRSSLLTLTCPNARLAEQTSQQLALLPHLTVFSWERVYLFNNAFNTTAQPLVDNDRMYLGSFHITLQA